MISQKKGDFLVYLHLYPQSLPWLVVPKLITYSWMCRCYWDKGCLSHGPHDDSDGLINCESGDHRLIILFLAPNLLYEAIGPKVQKALRWGALMNLVGVYHTTGVPEVHRGGRTPQCLLWKAAGVRCSRRPSRLVGQLHSTAQACLKLHWGGGACLCGACKRLVTALTSSLWAHWEWKRWKGR